MDTRSLSEIKYSSPTTKIIVVIVLTILAASYTYSQEPPSGPPDIDVSTAPPFTPGDPETWIIPPFNSVLPESTTLGEDQSVVLRAVSTNSELTPYQWFKDGEALSGKTNDTLKIEMVSPEDAGVYRVDVGEGSLLVSSTEIEFLVVPLSEIDELFSEWLSRFFSLGELGNTDISGESADPDQDGVSNLFEYALGLNPTLRETPPKLIFSNQQSPRPSLVFVRAKNRDSITYTVEGSSTLTNWTPLPTTATRIDPLDQSTEGVEIEVEWDKDTEFPRFLRLKASQTTP